MNISIQTSCQSLVTENRVHHVKVKDGSRIGQAVGDASLSLAPAIFFMIFPTEFYVFFFSLILFFNYSRTRLLRHERDWIMYVVKYEFRSNQWGWFYRNNEWVRFQDEM
jgi:hypothetical protein